MARPRTWTDEQLKKAIATSSTWGEVVTRIGHADYGPARRVMQAHAVRLDLDVTHLPPFKPIAPRFPYDRPVVDAAQLSAAIAASISWAGVLHQLGFGQSGSAQSRLRKQAEALGLDFSHFRGQAWGAAPVDATETPFGRERDVKLLHRAACAYATAWFMERGYTVSVPVEPTIYDLVVDSAEGLFKVQVKSTVTKERTGRWLVQISRMAYEPGAKVTRNGARVRCSYAPGEIDYFFVVTPDDYYLIPLTATKGLRSLTLDSKYGAFKVA
jgi:hypothetical protein